MIVILSAQSHERTAQEIAKLLSDAFKGQVQIAHADISAPSPWPLAAAWDDLLIVLYGDTPVPETGNDFVSTYLADRKGEGLLLPIALDSAHTRPPKAAEEIKASFYDPASASMQQRLTQRIGSMLGLRVLYRDTKIFISYRASDGTPIALQLEEKLRSFGYPVWRDEAKELDGETKILPGTPVQKQIDDALSGASIVLLLDTPQAPHSHWIQYEVNSANGMLVPILPLCFRSATDTKKGPRFRSLQDLQRWVELPFVDPPPTPPLADADLDRVVAALEKYLCELYQRKCRVPFIVEKEFVARDYSWQILDPRLLMCESIKKHSFRSVTKVLSHCSIFEQVHGPTMQAFSAFLKNAGRPNHALYIYDGELIPEPELKAVIEAAPTDDGVVILHHQELAALIDSNFTTFTP